MLTPFNNISNRSKSKNKINLKKALKTTKIMYLFSPSLPFKFYTSIFLLKKKDHLEVEDILNENIFYYSERKLRKIYHDEDLHANVIALIISLLLTPSRGDPGRNLLLLKPPN